MKTFIVTVIATNSEGQTTSTNYLFADGTELANKKAALEKYHYECYYAINQALPYALIDIRDERGAVIRMEIIEDTGVTSVGA